MDCFTVCVDYWDYLDTTLTRMAQWFDRITIVTNKADKHKPNVEKAWRDKGEPIIEKFRTDVFYANGAAFNKGAALEKALAAVNLVGWICVMDADILLPDVWERDDAMASMEPGNIYSPTRRDLPPGAHHMDKMWWSEWPLGDDSVTKCPGFMQIFHASDPILANHPWYPSHWMHGGGCDSDFCEKWPKSRQKRLEFDVLHLGEPRKNWCGRVTAYADGTLPPHAAKNAQTYDTMMQLRQRGGLKHEWLPKKKR